MGSFFSKRPSTLRHDRVVVITGCDTGFGHETAQKLDVLGYHVVAGCLNERGCENIRQKLSTRSCALVYDVTREEDHIRVSTEVERLYPNGIYGVICNAGIFSVGPAEWEPIRDIRRVFEVNFFGMVATAKAFLPQVRKQRGRFIFLASAVCRLAQADWSSYSASKFAISGYIDSLRRELHPFGIQVIGIEPGWTKTPLLDGFKDRYKNLYAGLDDDIKSVYGEKFLASRTNAYEFFLNHSATPEQVVAAIVKAVEDRNPYPRQAVGLDSKFVQLVTAILPVTWVDLALRWIIRSALPDFVTRSL